MEVIELELDDEELKATRKMFENKVKKMGEIRNKRIAECDRDELIARCCYDEQYIRILEEKLKMKEDIGIEKY